MAAWHPFADEALGDAGRRGNRPRGGAAPLPAPVAGDHRIVAEPAGRRARRPGRHRDRARSSAIPTPTATCARSSSASRRRSRRCPPSTGATAPIAVLGARAARGVHQARRSRISTTCASPSRRSTRRLSIGARARLCFQSRVGPQRWLRPDDRGGARRAGGGEDAGGRRRARSRSPASTSRRSRRSTSSTRSARRRPASCTSRAPAPSAATRRSSRRWRTWSRRRRARAAGPEVAAVRVTIVGGGISGLTAAHLAAARGHDVTCSIDARPTASPAA